MVEEQNREKSGKNAIIAVLGPTACGKTVRAVDLARAFNGEIISADSRQVYRGMDLGTGKDLKDYGEIPYHIIDVAEAGEKYNLHKYLADFHRTLKSVQEKGKRPILCGGTGMYLETALSGVCLPEVPANPELREQLEKLSLKRLTEILSGYKDLHNTTDVDTVKRAVRAIEIEEYYNSHPEEKKMADRKLATPLPALIIGLDIQREKRRERISHRLLTRLDEGMVEEVRSLLNRGISPEDLIYYGLEYKFLTLFVIGKLSYDEMVNNLEIAIHQFAKRQQTWFRGMEKRGFKIHWLPYDLPKDEFLEAVAELDSQN